MKFSKVKYILKLEFLSPLKKSVKNHIQNIGMLNKE